MIYFSELKNKEVFTEDNIKVGWLDDLVFLTSEIPEITKLVVADKTKNRLMIPVEFLKKINSVIVIKKNYQTTELGDDELFLLRNIQDKQIIDFRGNKIVRVNDVVLQHKDSFYVTGVDIGIFGVLRWFGLETFFNKIATLFHVKHVSQFLSWGDIQPLELARGKVKLKKEDGKLEKLHAEDLADYLEKTNFINTAKIIKMLDEKFAAKVISSLNVSFQTSLFKHFSTEKAARLVVLLDPDEAVDVLLTLSLKRREQILDLLPKEKAGQIRQLLALSGTPIGELITSEYFTVLANDSAKAVVQKIKQQTSDFSICLTVYVLNEKKELIGVFNLHELLLQDEDTPVYKFMVQNLIVIHLTTPLEIAVKKILKYKLITLPVVSDEKTLLGLVTIDDLTGFILKKIS